MEALIVKKEKLIKKPSKMTLTFSINVASLRRSRKLNVKFNNMIMTLVGTWKKRNTIKLF